MNNELDTVLFLAGVSAGMGAFCGVFASKVEKMAKISKLGRITIGLVDVALGIAFMSFNHPIIGIGFISWGAADLGTAIVP